MRIHIPNRPTRELPEQGVVPASGARLGDGAAATFAGEAARAAGSKAGKRSGERLRHIENRRLVDRVRELSRIRAADAARRRADA